MRARISGLSELTSLDIMRWRDLAACALEPNVFFEPDFVLAARDGLGGRGVGLLIVEDGDRWIACLPVHRGWRWRRLPVPVLATWRHMYSFLGTPLVAADRAEPALRLLVDHGRSAGTGILALEKMGADGLVWSTLEAEVDSRPGGSVCFERIERAALVRRPEPTYLTEMRPHRRRELNRQERGLERELSGSLLLRERSEGPGAYDDFLQLEAAGWKGRNGTAFACDPGHAAFFRTLCAAYARVGRLQLLDLSVDGRTVAMKCNLVAGDVVFCFKIAYDEQYAAYSPGLLLERRTIDVFHARAEVVAMDSCADPHNTMINRLWPDRRSTATMLLPADGVVGRLALQSARAAVALHGRAQSRRAQSPG
jgi:CelD/BcsL family acetyltransferase involved in cellulose biosynthesis